MLLLNAGHEATVHGLGNGVKALLESGLDLTAAFADAPATEATVEELLRFDAPLHLFTRYALEDVEVAGLRLAQGDRIGLLLGAAQPGPESLSGARASRSALEVAQSACRLRRGAFIFASAHRWRGWKCGWRCQSWSSVCRVSGSQKRRAIATLSFPWARGFVRNRVGLSVKLNSPMDCVMINSWT